LIIKDFLIFSDKWGVEEIAMIGSETDVDVLRDLEKTALVISPEAGLTSAVQEALDLLDYWVETASDAASAMAAIKEMQAGVILLDTRLAELGHGRLLAMIEESGVHERCAIALMADEVSDDWIARLREGVIDDIVPASADSVTWNTHLSTMQRGHRMAREIDALRQAAAMQMERDRVTGVLNREALLSVLFRETDRVQRMSGSLSLVTFDIDDFGHWNDELGREACDQLLREVASRSSCILRSYDLLGRVGPDEFLMALPGCSTVNAVMQSERVKMDVFGELFTVEDELGRERKVKLTACFGYAASYGRSPVVVLREAEEALRKMKAADRSTADERLGYAMAGRDLPRLFTEAEKGAY
jgi:two-component system cell cycle response regulator